MVQVYDARHDGQSQPGSRRASPRTFASCERLEEVRDLIGRNPLAVIAYGQTDGFPLLIQTQVEGRFAITNRVFQQIVEDPFQSQFIEAYPGRLGLMSRVTGTPRLTKRS